MRCICFFAFLIAMALSPIAMAQVPVVTPTPAVAPTPAAAPTPAVAPTPSVEELQKAAQTSAKDAAALRDVATKLKEQNDELRKRVEGKESDLWTRYYKAKESGYDFQIEMMNINSRSFLHQNVASYVILALVVFVVGGGLFFAHIQLMAGLRPITAFRTGVQATGTPPIEGGTPTPATGNADVPLPEAPATVPLGTTALVAELGKVTVTSSVVGVIVLVISLAFLYIYTREVYHIQVVDPFRPTLKDPAQAEPAKGANPAQK